MGNGIIENAPQELDYLFTAKKYQDLDDTGCEKLVAAIVKMACDDWLDAMRRTAKLAAIGKIDTNRNVIVRECERFFRSRYFGCLTGIEGRHVLLKLKEIISEEGNSKPKRRKRKNP